MSEEKDAFGKSYETLRKNGHMYRRYVKHFTNPLWAGFGEAELTDEYDVFTGLQVSRSQIMGFNEFGGSDSSQDMLVEGRKMIMVSREKGRVFKVFEGENVGYDSGRIYDDTVTVSDYSSGKANYWSSRDIASLVTKHSWNAAVQAEGVVIHSSAPRRIQDPLLLYMATAPCSIPENTGSWKLIIRSRLWVCGCVLRLTWP